jgi:hypothetical protein
MIDKRPHKAIRIPQTDSCGMNAIWNSLKNNRTNTNLGTVAKNAVIGVKLPS